LAAAFSANEQAAHHKVTTVVNSKAYVEKSNYAKVIKVATKYKMHLIIFR